MTILLITILLIIIIILAVICIKRGSIISSLQNQVDLLEYSMEQLAEKEKDSKMEKPDH